MKKSTATILFIFLFYNIFSQPYNEQLKRVNDFLKTFDGGYYGYLEVKDGYLYDLFKDGQNYCKIPVKELGEAVMTEVNRKVSLKCKADKSCAYSTYTSSNHESLSFSQSSDFNTASLITLLNNLVAALNNKSTSIQATTETKPVTSNNSEGYSTALKKLNDYLKVFDNGYYGYFEVIGDEIFIRLKSGSYCQAKINEIDKAYVLETNKKIEFRCLDGENCMTATYTTGKINALKMYQDKNFDSEEFIQLINDLISTLKKKNTNTQYSINDPKNSTSGISKTSTSISYNNTSGYSSSNGNYQTALKKLNDYLKTFDNGYYGYFEVKDGYIYDRFKAGKYNKFKMEDMEGAVIQEQYKRVIFRCKSGNCISTDWIANGKELYTQFTQSSSFNYQELATLLNDFRDAYLVKKTSSNSTYNSSTATKTEAQKIRDQKDKERQGKTSTKSNDANDLDEDRDALDASAAELQTAVSKNEKESKSKTIAAKTKVKLKNVFHKNSNFEVAKKYFGKTGITQTLMTFSGDNYFRGKVKFDDGTFMYFDNAEFEIISNASSSNIKISTGNYQTALNNLNEYLKTFNPETYDKVEVKDNKVFYYFKIYSMVYNSSIDIIDLIQNTSILNAKSVGEFGSAEIKIFCKDDKKCFYSTYSKGNADHFRFFSNTVKDLTKMEQLVKAFVNSLSIP